MKDEEDIATASGQKAQDQKGYINPEIKTQRRNDGCGRWNLQKQRRKGSSTITGVPDVCIHDQFPQEEIAYL